MSKFPVELTDSDGIVDAVNYLLSGNSSLGQNGQTFFSYQPSYVTGNFRIPFSNSSSVTYLYVAPISLSTSTWLDDFTWKYEFAVAQVNAPFAIGNNVTVTGVSPSDYDGTYNKTGVVECTTTYVIVRSVDPYPNPGPGTGGTIELFVTSGPGATMSTDCNAFATVSGGNEVVSVSGQIDLPSFEYQVFEAGTLNVSAELNRYIAVSNNNPNNPQYFFEFDKTLMSKTLYSETVPGTVGVITALSFSGTKPVTAGEFYNIQSFQMTVLTGSGSGQEFNITFDTSGSSAYSTGNTTITIGSGGYAFAPGDTILILGSELGGVDGVNDMTITVSTISNSSVVVADKTAIFTPILDNPVPGYYWYILEIAVVCQGSIAVDYISMLTRSLTAQVIKR